MTDSKKLDLNVLGQILDTTWGRSSTAASASPQWSIKTRFLNDEHIIATYTTIVNLGRASDMHLRAKALEEDGVKLIKKCVTGIKEQYSDKTGKSVKVEILNHRPEIEYTSMSPYNEKKTVYFRVTATLKYS